MEMITPNGVEILMLEPSEWQDYKDLRLRALKIEPQAFGSSYEDTVNRPDSYWQDRLQTVKEHKNQWMLFAKKDGKLVGMMGAFRKVDPEAEDFASIIAVYVDKEARGLGIGKTLLTNIIDELKNEDWIKSIKLSVNTDQTSAVKLYESLGFKKTGSDKEKLGDGIEHIEEHMELKL